MKIILTFVSFVLFTFCSLGQKTNDLTYTKSDKVALHFIQLCVDLTLHLDSGLNTGKYLIDFSITKDLNRQGINRFFNLNINASEANLDSLFLHDTTWIKYQFFQNPVIRFDKIQEKTDSIFIINTSKTKSSDGAVGTEIILQQQGDDFKTLSSRITWIS